MINREKVLAIIPARKGSKRLPGKNLIDFNGNPLIYNTFNCAKESKYIDRIILSTDCLGIKKYFVSIGGEDSSLRPDELATDESPVTETIHYILYNIDESFDWFILLQPTSPLRTSDDVDLALEKTLKQNANVCISATKFQKKMNCLYKINNDVFDSSIEDFANDEIYLINGAIYIVNIPWFKKTKQISPKGAVAFIMPYERSIDIDYDYEYTLAKVLHKNI